MEEGNPKVFSLSEANELIPKVVEFTAEVVRQLDDIRQRYQVDFLDRQTGISDSVMKEVEQTLLQWSKKVELLGAQPKAYFTVDFQSVDPELLFCWTYGEESITHTHKVWENFSHRRPLPVVLDEAMNHLKWIN